MHTWSRLSKSGEENGNEADESCLPVWIGSSEIDQWQEFQRQHPEGEESSREKLEAARKLEEGVRPSSSQNPRFWVRK